MTFKTNYLLKPGNINAILDILCSRLKEFHTVYVAPKEHAATGAATTRNVGSDRRRPQEPQSSGSFVVHFEEAKSTYTHS